MTIQQAFSGLAGIYAEANALTTINGRAERHAFLNMACADLRRCVQVGDEKLYPIALAQVFAWTMCLSEELFRGRRGGTTLAYGMVRKYPAQCAYCGLFPCVCEERSRHEPTLGDNRERAEMTLVEWQQHIGNLYHEKNKPHGIYSAIAHLFEEVAEVGRMLYLVEGADSTLADIKEKYANELADVIAWLMSVANLLGVVVNDAVYNLYRFGCPACGIQLCQCSNFSRLPSGELSHRFRTAAQIHKHKLTAA